MVALGRLPAIDERDNLHLMTIAPTQRVRQFWITGPILDQDGIGACVGFGWKQFLQTIPRRTLVGPSGFDIYYAAQKIDEWPGESYEGSSVRAGAKVLQAMGYLSEYLWAPSILAVKNWVLQRGPVVVGTNWYTGMFATNKDGFVSITGQVEGGHCYLINGYSTAQNAFQCTNSWSKNWGRNGKFWIHYNVMNLLLFGEGGEACTTTEKRII